MNTAARGGLALLATCLMVPGLTAPARAAAPAANRDHDRQLIDTLRDIHDRGADLYNNGDEAGCYRLFQGALMALKPELSGRPDLQRTIEQGLADAERHPRVQARAFALHRLIEDVRVQLKTGARAEAPKPKPEEKTTAVEKLKPPKPEEKPKEEVKPEEKPRAASLWDRLGGEAGVKKVVDDFTARAAKDPWVDFTRGGKYKPSDEDVVRFKQSMVEFVSQHTGGPLKYTGKSMKEVHQGMGISNAEFDAAVLDLRRALEKNHANPADVAALLRIVETTRRDIVEPEKIEASPKTEGTPAPTTEEKPKGEGAKPAKKEENKKGGDTKPAREPEEDKDGDRGAKGKQPERGETVKLGHVSGKVTFRGQPLVGGSISFIARRPTLQHEAVVLRVAHTAAIQDDGTYDLRAVKPGEYVVTITGPPAPPALKDPRPGGAAKPSPLPAKYGDPKTSALRCRVREGKQTQDFDLQ